MAPCVSVVIDNYNYGLYLGQAIESVLEQDFSGEIECIVVDDGSTDHSRQVVASFGQRVHGVFQTNQGQASAFNNGFSAARGEFVCLLDSDDYWAKDKLKKTISAFQDSNVGFVQHYVQDVDAVGRILPRSKPYWPPTYTLKDYLNGDVHWTSTSGLTFRSSLLEKIIPIPKTIFYYLDDLLCIRALFMSRVANVPEALGFHRIHGKNFCAEGYWDPKKLALDIQMRQLLNLEVRELLTRHNEERTRRSLDIEELEYFRRRILMHIFNHRRKQAAQEWWAMAKRYGHRGFGLFRVVSCLIALVSPKLYGFMYEIYSRMAILPRLRLRFFPE